MRVTCDRDIDTPCPDRASESDSKRRKTRYDRLFPSGGIVIVSRGERQGQAWARAAGRRGAQVGLSVKSLGTTPPTTEAAGAHGSTPRASVATGAGDG